MRIKGEQVIAASLEGGAVGGVVQTVHYDERKLSAVDAEAIRASSLGGARLNSITGGYNMDMEKDGQRIRSSSISGAVVETIDHSYKLKM